MNKKDGTLAATAPVDGVYWYSVNAQTSRVANLTSKQMKTLHGQNCKRHHVHVAHADVPCNTQYSYGF